MKRIAMLVALTVAVATDGQAADFETVSAELAAEKGCLSCHECIDRFTDGPMQETIEALGIDFGDPACAGPTRIWANGTCRPSRACTPP